MKTRGRKTSLLGVGTQRLQHVPAIQGSTFLRSGEHCVVLPMCRDPDTFNSARQPLVCLSHAEKAL